MNALSNAKWIIVAAALSGAAGAILGSAFSVREALAKDEPTASATVLTVKELRLADSEGNLRARLHFPSGGRQPAAVFDHPVFDMIDSNGKVRLSIGMEPPSGKPYVKMSNGTGEETLYMGFDEFAEESPGLYIYKRYQVDHRLSDSRRKRVLLPIEVIWPNP